MRTYTLTSQDGKERTWPARKAEIEIGDLQDALEALTAGVYPEKAASQQEIVDDDASLTITLYPTTAANVVTEKASPMSARQMVTRGSRPCHALN